MTNQMNLLGCPKCGKTPEVTQVEVEIFMVRCLSHPHFPVVAYGDSLIEAITEWNDDDWIRLGADEKLMAARPKYEARNGDKDGA